MSVTCEEPALSAASTCVQSSTSPRILPKPVEEAGGVWRLWLNSMSSTRASMAWGEKSLATTDVACRLAPSAGSPKPQPNCTGHKGVVALVSPRNARRCRPHAWKQCCASLRGVVAEKADGGARSRGEGGESGSREREAAGTAAGRHLMHLLGSQLVRIAQTPVQQDPGRIPDPVWRAQRLRQ